jgi:hypothetical protein
MDKTYRRVLIRGGGEEGDDDDRQDSARTSVFEEEVSEFLASEDADEELLHPGDIEPWQETHETGADTCEAPVFMPALPCQCELADEKVKTLANKSDKIMAMSHCIGPSLRSLVESCLAHFFVEIILLALGIWRSRFDETDTDPRLAIMILMVLLWLCLVVKHFSAELQVFRYTTIPYVQVQGYWQVLGFNVGFTVYTIWGLTFSMLQLTGLFTNTLFTANNIFHPFTSRRDIDIAVGSFQHMNVSEAATWCVTLNESAVPPLARAEWKDLVLGISWLLTALPEIYSLMRYWPTREYSRRLLRDVSLKPFPADKVDHYDLFFGCFGTTSTGAAAYDMAEGTAMGTIRLQTPSFPKCKAEAIFRHIEEEVEKEATMKKSEVVRALNHIKGIPPRAVRRILLEGLARSAGIGNIQITLFAMHRLHNHGDYEFFKVFSIIIAIVPAFQSVAFGLQVLFMSMTSIRRAETLAEEMLEDSLDSEEDKTEKVLCSLKKWIVALLMAWLCNLAALVFVLTKFMGALQWCEFYLWNLKGACVDLTDSLSKLENCTMP